MQCDSSLMFEAKVKLSAISCLRTHQSHTESNENELDVSLGMISSLDKEIYE